MTLDQGSGGLPRAALAAAQTVTTQVLAAVSQSLRQRRDDVLGLMTAVRPVLPYTGAARDGLTAQITQAAGEVPAVTQQAAALAGVEAQPARTSTG